MNTIKVLFALAAPFYLQTTPCAATATGINEGKVNRTVSIFSGPAAHRGEHPYKDWHSVQLSRTEQEQLLSQNLSSLNKSIMSCEYVAIFQGFGQFINFLEQAITQTQPKPLLFDDGQEPDEQGVQLHSAFRPFFNDVWFNPSTGIVTYARNFNDQIFIETLTLKEFILYANAIVKGFLTYLQNLDETSKSIPLARLTTPNTQLLVFCLSPMKLLPRLRADLACYTCRRGAALTAA